MTANPLWGGRFAEGPAAVMREINASIPFDRRLWRHDLAGSRAHIAMLADRGIVARDAADRIAAGLDTIETRWAEEGVPVDLALEDIHMTVETALGQAIGPVAGRLHTARSRNDQVATDFRLWVRDAIDETLAGVDALANTLIERAAEHAATIMPGFTHLQVAQPMTLGHHLLAYVAMLGRDRSRLRDARERMNESPLGAAALAGTPYPVDREATARALGFDRPMANAMDAVSDRDFAVDYLFALAQIAIHLSRLAEEIVLWATPAFGFVTLPDEWSTGSSIMPQKRNPDAAELVRGHSGRVIGGLTALLVTLKGLPMAYSKDLQDDKPPVFEAHDLSALMLAATDGMMGALSFRPDAMRAACARGHPTATDLADWLVTARDVPFREAHGLAGRAVRAADERGCSLEELTDAELGAIDARLDGGRAACSLDASVASRTSFGGTAPERVREAVAAARAAWS